MKEHKKLNHSIFLILIVCFLISPNQCLYAKKPPIRVAFNCYSIPYNFIEDDINYRGMHIEIMNWIAKQKNMDIIYIPYETNGACLEALNKGAVDLILGHRTDDSSAAGLQYTAELSSSNLCLFVKDWFSESLKEIKDYRSFTVAVEYGTAVNAYMANMGIQRYLTQGNQISVLQSLEDGDADMALAVYDCFTYLTYQKGMKDDYSILRSYISPVSYAILVRPNDVDLFNTINLGLAEIRASGNYENIYNKWIIKDDSIAYAETMKKIKGLIIGIVFTALVILVSSVALNRILKVKVDKKTKELHNINAELDNRMIQLESESRLRNDMIEFAPTGMVLFNKDYKILLMNQAALQLSKLKECNKDIDVRTLNVFGDIIKGIEHNLFTRGSVNRKNKRPFTIELGGINHKHSYRYNIYRLYDEDGVGNVLLSVEDVTIEELEKQELFEKEKNKSLNRLIAGIAHEIKNPLMAIRTAASLLKSKGDDPEVQEAFVRFVPNEVDRINQLVESLINYARPFKGKSEKVFLSEMVRECSYLTNIAIKKDEINIKKQLDDTVVVFVNRDSIKQSVINIIMNGIESMSKKLQKTPNASLRMDINVRKDEYFSYLHIKDQGMGMNEKDIQYCIEPFYTTKLAGTGLGLALVQQFVLKNQGILEIKSKEGCYTEIILKFRRADINDTKDIDNR